MSPTPQEVVLTYNQLTRSDLAPSQREALAVICKYIISLEKKIKELTEILKPK